MDDIKRIVLPTPFPVGPVNSYLIGGDEPTLVDVGPRTEEGYRTLVGGLAKHGYRVKDIKRLIITHAHPDHCGLAGRLVEESGARVYTHESNVSMLTDYCGEWERRTKYLLEFYQRTGVPAETTSAMQAGRELLVQLADDMPVDRALRDGDNLTLGDHTWRVLHTPGHSAGCICLYQPEMKKLISGDHLLKDISSNPVVEPPSDGEKRMHSLSQYLRSLARIERLELDIIYPGHGELIGDHRDLIRRRCEFHQRRKEALYRAVRRGAPTVYELASEMFPGLPPFETALAIFEVIGHLDLLEDDGLIRYTRDGATVRVCAKDVCAKN